MMQDHGITNTDALGQEAVTELEENIDEQPYFWFDTVMVRKVGGDYAPASDKEMDVDDDDTPTEGSDETA